MKIIFFCGSIQLGKDGVGDYTRRLSGELLRLGHKVQIISLCDNHIISKVSENQTIEGKEVAVHRIPISVSNKKRFLHSQEIITNFQPDCISLQFVPYSFNPKGLPFWLPSFLSKLKGKHQWHIMFHELWLGIDLESSFRHKCIGKLQQLIVKKLINNLNPSQINTQNQLYQFHLQTINIVSDILPICGNIPVSAVKKVENEFTQFVLFGTIHQGAPFNDFIGDLVNYRNQLSKPVKFIFVGKNGSELANYENVLESFGICYDVLGVQSENVISEVLINSDYGISTTPYFQTEKSGVYAAYREHQLNTISVSREWTPTKGQYRIPHIIKYRKNNLNLEHVDVLVSTLSSITKQFINSISQI